MYSFISKMRVIFILYAAMTVTYSVFSASLIMEDDFEDGDYNNSDVSLTGGMSWTANSVVAVKGAENNKVLCLDAGAIVKSNQILPVGEYTFSFKHVNYYRVPASVVFNYLDDDNYYKFDLTNGRITVRCSGEDKILTTDYDERYLCIPRKNPSTNTFKIYFKNDGRQIILKVDKDGMQNGKDYEFSYIETDTDVISRFSSGGKLVLMLRGSWGRVHYDDFKVYDGLVEDIPVRGNITIYVDGKVGNDSNNGSEVSPVATIKKALELSLPGDTILVKDGQYDEDLNFNEDSGHCKDLKVYGTENERLLVKAEHKWGASIRSADFQYDENITLDGFEITKDSIKIHGGRNIWILNNYVHDLSGKVGISAGGEDGIVRGNYILRVNKGISVSGRNMLIENNEIERLIKPDLGGQDADYFRFFGEGHIIRNNYMHGTKHSEIGSSHTDGFQTFDNNGEYVRHIIIEGNFIEDFFAEGFMGEASYYHKSSDIVFRNNIFKDSSSWGLCCGSIKNVKAYNNIFINIKGIAIGLYGDDKEAYNNILYNVHNPFGDKGIKEGNNIIFSETKKVQASPYPEDIVNVNPLFINLAGKNFHLMPNSPAVDNGIALIPGFRDKDGNIRPIGNGWDIGPYEVAEFDKFLPYIEVFDCFGRPFNNTYSSMLLHFSGKNSYVPKGRNIVSYMWNFSDGSTVIDSVECDHAYKEAGIYTITLTTKDTIGKQAIVKKQISILGQTRKHLCLYINFDGNCKDLSGRNVFSGDNDLVYVDGRFGEAVLFNQDKNGGLHIPHNENLDEWQQFSMCFWAKKNNPNQDSVDVVHKHTIYAILLTKTGFQIRYLVSEQGEIDYMNALGNVDDGDWHFYAITYDGISLSMYIDGERKNTRNFSGRIKHDASRGLTIGGTPWDPSLSGAIDEVRFFDISISDSQVQQLFLDNKIDFEEDDIIGPNIGNGYPEGKIYNSNVKISVSTNEIAECRYSLEHKSIFGEMTRFDRTYGLLHESNVGILSRGKDYVYHILCQDEEGNLSEPYDIMFHIFMEDEADVNGDSVVDILDVQLVVNVILGTATNSRADVNGDGTTNVSDVQAVVNTVLG